jgi:RND family efflux transporter MFP subunit
VHNSNSPLLLRKNYENTLNQWKLELDTLADNHDSIYIQSVQNKNYLDNAYYLINSVSNVIDPANCNIYGGSDKIAIDSFRATVDAAKTSIESTRSALLASKSSLDTLNLAYNNASQNLEIKKNPYTQEDIDTQKALVDQAQANVDSYAAAYNKTVLYAPFASKVTKIVPEVGNIINANSTVISLIGGDTYQIETNVAESDIAKIKINNIAKITLDAYSSDLIFDATVVQIDLSATNIEGVASYKTILKFNKEDPRIMPGMTANIDIVANRKENVVYVPSRAIITKNGKKFVKLIINNKNKTIETNIITGIRGSDGRTEIISGLKVGDKILVN